MASPVAVGGGALGAAAVGVGGAYLAGAFEGSGSSKVETEPEIVLLLNEFNSSSVYATAGLIGKDYGHYLVAPIGSRGENDSKIDNQKWWKRSYERWQEDSKSANNSLSAEFKNGQINSPFSSSAATSDSPKALNQVCEAVYKKNKSSLGYEANAADNPTKLKNDLFRYCSIFGELKTIGEVSTETYANTKKGFDSAKIKIFIAVTGNDKFWEIRNKEFYAADGDKSKSNAKGNSSKFKEKSEANPNSKIRDICREAYESDKSDANNYPDDEISRFCVL
ncbi:hypothetical protein [Candidatus Mycoplasma haematohominis]|uniref:Uncharacterized protein n=1 Tax=Candidatus Mycoplasma haematohominis TaxID=1494318 RepID=A0A478FRT3_9MOLU|nr:hypothetical protein [Candidatus Mycoplasma haemohominis]GCE63066.1 hypothetical protein MHSWG343_00440 [Candidatus Mycoplasma haemohominis]